MINRNRETPMMPREPVEITPEEYEKQVVNWLGTSGHILDKFAIEHRKNISGSGGNYEFDAVAEFTVLCGAQFTILVECKRHNRPIERKVITDLYAKMQDVNANKAMVFSTSGFQTGAIEYATSKNIALVAFVEGSFLYHTRSANSSGTSTPPPWLKLPDYVGILTKSTKQGSISYQSISLENTDALGGWIES